MIVNIIMVILIITIILVINWRVRKRGHALAADAETAITEFKQISFPGRFSSTEELNGFISKYRPLSDQIVSFRHKFFVSKKFFRELELQRFLSFFSNVGKMHRENNELYQSIASINAWIDDAHEALKFYYGDHYFAFSEKEFFLKANKTQIDRLFLLYPKYSSHFSNPNIEHVYQEIKNIEDNRTTHNKFFVTTQLGTHKDFFDTVLPYPLDPQQREAIVKLEDNALVISSAGSGKTSTIIGKARYLLDKRNIDPAKLLILTYTRKAANELVERLGNDNVICTTFHSLAYHILAKLENKNPSICEDSLLLNVFGNLLKSDNRFLEAVLNYILHLQSLMKLEHEYNTAPDYFADRKKYGIQAPYADYKGNIIFTRSEEEKRICTFLTELGVNFLYEEPYPFNTYTMDYRQYKPDFTIVVNDPVVDPETGAISYRERRVYLEHFAINANGEVPKWFGDKDPVGGWYAQNKKYNDGIIWKRNLHAEKGTVLIETRSADFHSGNILDVLKQQLAKANVPINPVPAEELYDRLVKRSQKIESSVFNLLNQFIALLKSNCGSIQPYIDLAKQNNDTRTSVILSDVVNPLLIAYSDELKRRGEIDFTDAIIEATKYCAAGSWLQYDYILVDEFQDISVDRFHFLQFLRTKNPLTKLFCVGDDWQSIYRFAGSNMKLFYKFEDFFGFTEHCKIEKTYRFFNPLLDLSSDFIQRNPEQMKKDVKSNAKSLPDVAPDFPNAPAEWVNVEGKRLWFYSSDVPAVQEWLTKYRTTFEFHDCGSSSSYDSMLPTVTSLVEKIPQDETILILGRYNYDVRSLGYDTSKHDFDRNRDKIEVIINNRKIRFMSVHAAKGLEADNVILINCNEGIYGFPSLVEDDPILAYVLSDEDKYEYAEERRLFYVALTRAKKHLHVLYNGDKPSPFVRELTDVLKADEKLCPVCHEGHVVVIKHGIASNGNPYTNFGCSNANAGCEYFERVFGDDEPRFVKFNNELRAKQDNEVKSTAEALLKKVIDEANRDSQLDRLLALPKADLSDIKFNSLIRTLKL